MRLGQSGFSLLELMVGAAILLVVICATLFGFINAMLLNESSRNLTTAANDAQYVLEQMVRDVAYADLDDYEVPVFTNLPSEGIILSRSIGSSLSTIIVNVTWQERQEIRSYSLATYIAK